MITLPSLKEYASHKGEPMGDRREATGWRALFESKVGAPLVVLAVVTMLAYIGGLVSLPATVSGQSVRLGTVESKVEILERNEIRRDERQQQVLDILRELREDVKKMRDRR